MLKSCGNIFYPNYPFYNKFGRQSFWIDGKHSCLTQKRKIFKEIEADISKFLGYSFYDTYSNALV